MLKDFIQVAEEFQASVNIAYDLNNAEKIENIIPTRAFISLFEDVFNSTNDASTKRARILIGAYGKGKSHFVLTILGLLCRRGRAWKRTIFLRKVKAYNPDLYERVIEYIDSKKRFLPIVVSGNTTSITQSFLSALYNALRQNGMLGFMPETNFQAAINAIALWKKDYPQTHKELSKSLSYPVKELVRRLSMFDPKAYEVFVQLYPSLTSGSKFNPFSGFDTVELYERVAEKVVAAGYKGLLVVYDEFSKFLESSITHASISDIKTLQDFAEKCNRSGSKQLHLVLISHKEIDNYIDVLPKKKVDGWRGVSERFLHVLVGNDFKQVPEIVSATIIKESNAWKDYQRKHEVEFERLRDSYRRSLLFKSEFDKKEEADLIWGCFPLHPVTTYILPRLSEKVAQNERTMFTFLTGKECNTLSSFLDSCEDQRFVLATPDVLYDYFAPQMKHAPFTSDVHSIYRTTTAILGKLQDNSLAARIVKTIALVYVIAQFDRLSPVADLVFSLFQESGFTRDDIQNAFNELIDEQYVVYLKRSNAYLKLKESCGVDITRSINDIVERRRQVVSDLEILNEMNPEKYLYPNKYNSEFEMTRYFLFNFISLDQLEKIDDSDEYLDSLGSDGCVIGVIPDSSEDVESVQSRVQKLSENWSKRCVFIVSLDDRNIRGILRDYDAVSLLCEQNQDDPILFEEYDIVRQDLIDVVKGFISQFVRPELGRAKYYCKGELLSFTRKAKLTQFLSLITSAFFSKTPIINNETLNKNELSTMALNSRLKLINGILFNNTRLNLGLLGVGQDVSFMRSSLIVPGVMTQNQDYVSFTLKPTDDKLRAVFDMIVGFMENPRQETVSFEKLYELLMKAEFGIGLRKGVIPIYLAVIFSQYINRLVVIGEYGECKLTAELLTQINDDPKKYSFQILEWTDSKRQYIEQLAKLFADYVIEAERAQGGYSYIVNAMNRWYLGLSRYVKELRNAYQGGSKKTAFEIIEKSKTQFLLLLKQPVGAQELLFTRLPLCFASNSSLIMNSNVIYDVIVKEITKTKSFYDQAKYDLECKLIEDTRSFLAGKRISKKSLASLALEWYEDRSQDAKIRLFENGAERVLSVFSNVTNDEHRFINELARVVTNLRIDDWSEGMIDVYCRKLQEYLETILSFERNNKQLQVQTTVSSTPLINELENDCYSVTFVDDEGKVSSRVFKKEKNCSNRAKVLLNELLTTIDEYGQSVSRQEKRQVLMDVLSRLC